MGLLGYGTFCEVFGKTLRNNVLECILSFSHTDFAVSDFLEDMNISKPKAYQIIKELKMEGIIIESRVIGKTQLYKLNKISKKTKLLQQAFDHCVKSSVHKYVNKITPPLTITDKKGKYKKWNDTK